MPGVGIVVVEVKGGSVSVDEQGRWWSGRRHRDAAGSGRSSSARDGKYALRTFVEADPRWKNCHSRVRWGHAIVVPYTDLADDFATPDCPRWMISGRGDLDDLAGRLHDVCRAAGERPNACRTPTTSSSSSRS